MSCPGLLGSLHFHLFLNGGPGSRCVLEAAVYMQLTCACSGMCLKPWAHPHPYPAHAHLPTLQPEQPEQDQQGDWDR